MFDARRYVKYSHLPLAMYGAGGTAEVLWQYLPWSGVRIQAVCDRDPAKRGKLFHGLTILGPEELVQKYPAANIAIAVVDAHSQDVRAFLVSLGVREDRLFERKDLFDVLAPIDPLEFSLCPHLDLYRFINRLADEESKTLFRLRYRHWLLGDRPDNPGRRIKRDFPGVARYADSSELCCDLDRTGAALGGGDLILEFDNDDALARRVFFAVLRYRPDGAFRFRPGSEKGRTRFLSSGKNSRHDD